MEKHGTFMKKPRVRVAYCVSGIIGEGFFSWKLRILGCFFVVFARFLMRYNP